MKGQTVVSTIPLVESFTWFFQEGSVKSVHPQLRVCNDHEPPEYVKDPSNTPYMTICPVGEQNVSNRPADEFQVREAPDGTKYPIIHVQYVLELESGGRRFSVKIKDDEICSSVAPYERE